MSSNFKQVLDSSEGALVGEILWSAEQIAHVAGLDDRVPFPLPPLELDPSVILAERAQHALFDEATPYLVQGLSRVVEAFPALRAWWGGERDALDDDALFACLLVLQEGEARALALRYAIASRGALPALLALLDSWRYSSVCITRDGQQIVFCELADTIERMYGASWRSALSSAVDHIVPMLRVARRALALLTEEERAALLTEAERLFPLVPPPQQVYYASLFPDHADWVATCMKHLSAWQYLGSLQLLSFTTRDPEALATLFQERGMVTALFEPVSQTLLYEHGRALPALLAHLHTLEHVMPLVERVQAFEAIPFWLVCTAKHQAEGMARALDAMSGFAPLALVGLSHHEELAARVLSALLAERVPGALQVALDSGAAHAAHLEPLLPDDEAALAPVDSLPRVLRAPAWHQKKRKAVKAITLAEVAPPTLSPSLRPLSEPERADLMQRYPFDYIAGLHGEQIEKVQAHRRASIVGLASQFVAYPDLLREDQRSLATRSLLVLDSLEEIAQLWETLPRDLWFVHPELGHHLRYALSRHGEALIPIATELGAQHLNAAVYGLYHVTSPQVARLMAEALTRTRSQRALARQWLIQQLSCAVPTLLADAVGSDKRRRKHAEEGIAAIALDPARHEAMRQAAAAHHSGEALEALEQLLSKDPLEDFPGKFKGLPLWSCAGCMPRVQLASGPQRFLSPQAVTHLLELCTFADPERPYAGFEQVKQACTPSSLDAFALALCQRWLTFDASAANAWALHAVGLLGGDRCVRALTPQIRKWPGESAVKRAQWGLDALAQIGSDMALTQIYNISQKIKFASLKAHAQSLIERLAEERELTMLELGDRLVPDFDLDARGRLTLDFGPRQFEVGFDETLNPVLRDEKNKVIKSLPRPNASDDAPLAAEASATFKGLKKDIKQVAAQQLQRLEDALVTQRRWKPEDFQAFLVGHPLMLNLTHRLLWGDFDGPTLLRLFRVDRDHSLRDVEDEALTLRGDGVGLIHPSMCDADALSAWTTLFGEYEIIQPFAQLDRPFLPREEALARLQRDVFGKRIEAPRLVFGLEKQGWERGPAMEGGSFSYHTRPVDAAHVLVVQYEGHVGMGYIEQGELLTLEGMRCEADTSSHYAYHRADAGWLETLSACPELLLSEITCGLLTLVS